MSAPCLGEGVAKTTQAAAHCGISQDLGNGRLEKLIKVAFLLNGGFCLVGGFAYLFGTTILLFVTLNFGMGVSYHWQQ